MNFELILRGEDTDLPRILTALSGAGVTAAPVEAAEPKGEAPVEPIKVAEAKQPKTKKAAAAKPVEARPQMPEQAKADPAPVSANETSKPEPVKLTVEDLRAPARELSKAGRGAEVQAIIKKHGGTRLSDVPAANYAAALADLKEALA